MKLPQSYGKTYANPDKCHFIRHFFRFLKESREFVVAEFICTQEPSEIPDSSLKNAKGLLKRYGK